MHLEPKLAQRLIHLPRLTKRLLAIGFDALLCVATVWLALAVRLEAVNVPWQSLKLATLGAWVLGLPVFMHYGLYAAIFRYAGWNAMLALCKAVALYGALYVGIFVIISVPGVPRSVGLTQPLLMFVALGLSRLVVRLWLGNLYRELLQKLNAPGVLIYGAGTAGRQLAAALQKVSTQRLVGFIDDDPHMQRRWLDGIPVHASTELTEIIDKFNVRDVLLAMPSVSASRRKQMVEGLRPYPIHVRTLPGLDTLTKRGIRPEDLQELDIEDLLGRDPVAPEQSLMAACIKGKTVLVTGAGGSIGSELCRQILQWAPQRLLLLEHSEYALYKIHQELQALASEQPHLSEIEVLPLQGSVQDRQRVDDILRAWQPHTIYHAAAYKHVPLVEHNPVQGLYNNVWGTLECARAAALHGVERFVLISTDKAVRPTNVMGASKRLAEMVLQALAAQQPSSGTCYTMVRFGNVLGSSGSVVPLFRSQIAAGGPITLTHQDITRYFMTIPEAAQLVLQAGAMAQGGDVFVLDMGEPVRIYDLACRMVELTGQHVRSADAPWGDIAINITGLRPGEKLYEELLIGDNTQPTTHPRILKAREQLLPWQTLEPALHSLATHMENRDHAAIRAQLQQLVEGYRPSGPMVDWVEQARG